MKLEFRRGAFCLLAFASLGLAPSEAFAEDVGDSLILQSLDETNRLSSKTDLSKFTSPEVDPRTPRLCAGINYTGAQLRWNFSSHWASEARYQQGSASSNYGTVTSHVFGGRLYHFFKTHSWLPFYLGSEGAYTNATPDSSVYKTSGFALGAFGGLEYHVVGRLYVDADLGPYVISLTESQTHQSSTNLDFIVNSALLVRLF